ncbi:hypothetical protein HMPREF9374_1091 [Desmospora sp. 8437]|nr:hypothetical protein HMPREF9374_1091 [Desmospora sp. 8437]
MQIKSRSRTCVLVIRISFCGQNEKRKKEELKTPSKHGWCHGLRGL